MTCSDKIDIIKGGGTVYKYYDHSKFCITVFKHD